MIVEKVSIRANEISLTVSRGPSIIPSEFIFPECGWPTITLDTDVDNYGTNLASIGGYDCVAYNAAFSQDSFSGGIMGGTSVGSNIYRGGVLGSLYLQNVDLGLAVGAPITLRYFPSLAGAGSDTVFAAIAGSTPVLNNSVILNGADGNYYCYLYRQQLLTYNVVLYNLTDMVQVAAFNAAADILPNLIGNSGLTLDGGLINCWFYDGGNTRPVMFSSDGSYFYLTYNDPILDNGASHYPFGGNNANRVYYGIEGTDGNYYVASFDASGDSYDLYNLGSDVVADAFYMFSLDSILGWGTFGVDPVQHRFQVAVQSNVGGMGAGQSTPIQRLGCTNYCIPLNGA